jgi:UDP-N-acetylglucosamine--N-acetylmuramyl-(pentapeptide) pyrophosphoryl-undecaprenol N-acetylglucosamine transferase
MATVVLAGGGTAGHIEPALAVAREWMTTNPSDKCIFLGTKTGLENTLVPVAGFDLFLKSQFPGLHLPRGYEFHLI